MKIIKIRAMLTITDDERKMKKIGYAFFIAGLLSLKANAQQFPFPVYSNKTFANEVATLGAMGGYAYACNIKTELDTFEVIVTDLIHNVSVDDIDEINYKKLYLDNKMKFFKSYQQNPPMRCEEIKERFFAQSIFRFMKNPDGSMIDPDGRLIKRGYPLPF